jgi:hypothetical protein
MLGTAQLGQYANVGVVTATTPLGDVAATALAGLVTDTDPSHYLGIEDPTALPEAPLPERPYQYFLPEVNRQD